MWNLRRKPNETIELVIPPSTTTRRIIVVNRGGHAAQIGVEATSDVTIVRGEAGEKTKAAKVVAGT